MRSLLREDSANLKECAVGGGRLWRALMCGRVSSNLVVFVAGGLLLVVTLIQAFIVDFFFILSFPTWSRSYSLGHKHTATHIFTHNSMNTTSWVLLFKYVILIITYPSCVNVPIIRFGGIALIQQTDFGTRSKVHGQRRPYQLLVCNDFEKLLELVVRLSSSHLEDIDVTARHIVGQVHQR